MESNSWSNARIIFIFHTVFWSLSFLLVSIHLWPLTRSSGTDYNTFFCFCLGACQQSSPNCNRISEPEKLGFCPIFDSSTFSWSPFHTWSGPPRSKWAWLLHEEICFPINWEAYFDLIKAETFIKWFFLNFLGRFDFPKSPEDFCRLQGKDWDNLMEDSWIFQFLLLL